MKKLFKNRPLSILTLFGILAWLNTACQEEKAPVKTREAARVITGIDLSGTTEGFTRADTAWFRQVINICQASKRPVELAFRAVGNPSDSAFIRLNLKALPHKDNDMTEQRQGDVQSEINRIRRENASEIERFQKHVQALLQKTDDAYTDINGFFSRSNNLISENKGIKTIVFLQTDGKHDTKNSSVLDCGLLNKTCFMAVSGWKNPTICRFDGTPEAPEGFLQILKQQLEKD